MCRHWLCVCVLFQTEELHLWIRKSWNKEVLFLAGQEKKESMKRKTRVPGVNLTKSRWSLTGEILYHNEDSRQINTCMEACIVPSQVLISLRNFIFTSPLLCSALLCLVCVTHSRVIGADDTNAHETKSSRTSVETLTTAELLSFFSSINSCAAEC